MFAFLIGIVQDTKRVAREESTGSTKMVAFPESDQEDRGCYNNSNSSPAAVEPLLRLLEDPFIQVHRVPAVSAPPKKTSQKYATTLPLCRKVPRMNYVIEILMNCSGCPNISKRRRSNKNPVLKTNTVV